jgi:hypothetical protein
MCIFEVAVVVARVCAAPLYPLIEVIAANAETGAMRRASNDTGLPVWKSRHLRRNKEEFRLENSSRTMTKATCAFLNMIDFHAYTNPHSE